MSLSVSYNMSISAPATKAAKTLDPASVVTVQLISDEGERAGSQLQLPQGTTAAQLQTLLNGLLSNEEPMPYAFFINDIELTDDVGRVMLQNAVSVEQIVDITYRPQAIFRIRPVARCSATMEGHKDAVLSVQFSADGKRLATGSGDSTVRFWDLQTQLPLKDGRIHNSWVMACSWSPDAAYLASGDKNGSVCVWDASTAEPCGMCKGHTKWITALAWEPAHLALPSRKFASASKDKSVRVWDAVKRSQLLSMAGHTNTVNALRWCGSGLLISGSNDREIRIWNSGDGRTVRVLSGHAHWVNSLALSTDYALRTGAHDHNGTAPKDLAEARQAAKDKYEAALGGGEERLVSGSDDHTLFLWTPAVDKRAKCRMTGHQQLINHVQFSPDGRWLLSASFDKSVKLWDGVTGQFLATMRGHVGPVYQLSWSADSRMFVSASKDSTIKVWDLRTRKLKVELPGHADEVFAVDWSPDGGTVASGGKDRVVKLWRQ
eukprot:jgi/Ulvmu1/2996/UM015_0036.1